MSTRAIPKNYRNLTGKIASVKNKQMTAFESTLERDFYLLLEFDIFVESFKEQPLTLTYKMTNGKDSVYTPDVFIKYRKDIEPSNKIRPWLCEVKYRKDLFENWKTLKPKFKAARKLANQKGWEFKIITENEIRVPFLDNAKFLLKYRDILSETDYVDKLLFTLAELEETNPKELLSHCYSSRQEQAKSIAVLWKLVCEKRIGIDLRLPLNMNSRIWTLPDELY